MTGLIEKLWDIQCVVWQYMNNILHITLSAEITNIRLSLDRTLRQESMVGFVDFPDIIKATLPITTARVMKDRGEDRKGWTILIRKIRGNMNDERTKDEFSDPKNTLREWLGM